MLFGQGTCDIRERNVSLNKKHFVVWLNASLDQKNSSEWTVRIFFKSCVCVWDKCWFLLDFCFTQDKFFSDFFFGQFSNRMLTACQSHRSNYWLTKTHQNKKTYCKTRHIAGSKTNVSLDRKHLMSMSETNVIVDMVNVSMKHKSGTGILSLENKMLKMTTVCSHKKCWKWKGNTAW